MSGSETAWPLLLGLGTGAGLLLVAAGWRGISLSGLVGAVRRSGSRGRVDRDRRRRLGAALAAVVVVAAVTRWPVAAAAAGALVWCWPRLAGGRGLSRAKLARLEALATWTESMRDTVAAAAGLEVAIPTTVATAPADLRHPLERLVGMLRAQVPMQEALGRLGEDLDDPTADLVIAALVMNAELRGPALRATLTRLAGSIRSELQMRQEVDADRASLRRSVWIIVGTSFAFAGFLAVTAPDFVAPYATPVGQIALAGVLAIFAAAFAWLRTLVQSAEPARFLASADQLATVHRSAPGRTYRSRGRTTTAPAAAAAVAPGGAR